MEPSLRIRAFDRDWMPYAIAAAAVALTASVFYTPLPLVLAVCIPACFYFIRRPYELLLLMVFFIPFNFVVKVGPLPVAFEVVKILAWGPFLLTRSDRPAFVDTRWKWWFAVLGGVIVLSLIRAHDFPFTLKECVRLGSNLGLVYLCINLVDSPHKVLQIFRVLTISTFVVALYGFYQWIIKDYGALFWIVNPRLDTNLAHYRDYFWEWRNRIISVLTSEMELGHYFNLCIPIGILLWVTEGRKRLGSKWLMMTLAMFAGLLLTFTFGAWLAFAATCGLGILIAGGRKRWKVLLVAMLVGGLVVGLLALGPLRPFIEQKAAGNAIGSLAWDAATRLIGWRIALLTWWSHPLIGAGIGNFEFYSAEYDFVLGAKSQGSSPHQTYLYLLANYGLLGTIAVLVIFLGSVRSNLRLARSHPQFALIALALAFAVAVNLMGGFSDDSTYLGPHTSYLLWLMVGLSEAIRNMAPRPPAVSPSEA